jgi:integrase
MILRENKVILDEYYLELRNQVAERSFKSAVSHLRTFLEFMGEKPFSEVTSVAKSYKVALANGELRKDQSAGRIAPEYLRKNLGSVRAFLVWLRDEKGVVINDSWLKRNLSLTKSESNEANQRKPFSDSSMWFTLDEVVQLAQTPSDGLAEDRTKAAIIFLLMSGMRISAFLSMPIKAVDFTNRTVTQTSLMGVRTKANKSGVTTILPFEEYPELMAVVKDWDTKVRSSLSPNAKWYANITPLTGELDPSIVVGQKRDSGFRKDMAQFLGKAGLAYKSPHKLRHGHIRFLRDKSENMKDLEAIADNCLQTTPTMLRYAELSPEQTRSTINRLSGLNHDNRPINRVGAPDAETIRWVLGYLQNNFPGQP